MRPIFPPYFLRLEAHGELIAMDNSGLPYYTSGNKIIEI